MITAEQIDFYGANGFLHIPQIYTERETSELSAEMDRLVDDWAFTRIASGDMDKRARLIASPRIARTPQPPSTYKLTKTAQ